MTGDKSKLTDETREADEPNTGEEQTVVLSITESGEVVADNVENQPQGQEATPANGNLLEQAFVEASEELPGDTAVVQTEGVEDGTTVIEAKGAGDGTTVVQTEEAVTGLEDGSTVVQVTEQMGDGTGVVQASEHLEDGTNVVSTSVSNDTGVQYTLSENGQTRIVTAEELASQNYRLINAETGDEIQTTQGMVQSQQSLLKPGLVQLLSSNNAKSVKVSPPPSVPSTVKIIPSASNVAPIGSSQNPIRIVQQGNQYTSVQQLDSDQLQQIMQVVQQQQQRMKKGSEPTQTVIYNPSSQTRIVYRVIYPSELHKSTSQQPHGENQSQAGRRHTIQIPKNLLTVTPGTGAPRRQYRKRKNEEDERLDLPELSKEEKEAKKNTRPKTRFGRVSKPPKHMVKDYKHIHLVDWDEDYDDSDGGYSDFRASESEEYEEDNAIREFYRKNIDSDYVHPAINSSKKSPSCLTTTAKPRNYKCRKCDKAYIGQGGLARHYRMNPDHDILGENNENNENEREEAKKEEGEKIDENPNSSNTTSDVAGKTVAIEKPTAPIPRAVLKTRQAYAQETTPAKRKARLKEFMRQCDDEELMEVVLPRLSKVITTYEFLLMRVERGRPLKPHIQDVLLEFEKLHKQVSKMCQEHLKLVKKNDVTVSQSQNLLQVTDSTVAQSLGLETGAYEILEPPPPQSQSPFKYKLLTTLPETEIQGASAKRTIETVSPEQLTGSAAKKPKAESIFKVTSEGLKIMSQLPERKLVRSPSSQPQMRKTERKCSSNVTLLRSPGANSACDQVSSQARVFVINPQSNSTNAKTVVQTILPATANHADSSSTVSNTVISDVSSTVEQTESVESVTTAAVKNESSSGKVATTTVSNLKLGNELPNKENVQSERTTQEVKLNTEGEEKVILESEQHENIKIEVVAVEGADSGAAGGDGGEIIEQQHLLPGQILQVRDTDGRIIHVTAGEDGELIQMETDENGVPLQEVIETTQVITHQHSSQGEEVEQQTAEAQSDVYQTEDGVIFIQNADGSIQVHGHSDQPIPLETVQALLAMESEGQITEQLK